MLNGMLITNGRFIVHLPFKNDVSKLGNSYNTAKRRLLLFENRFQKDPELKADYVKFMLEYEELDHMEQVDEVVLHHAVRNESSTTTKLRVVFDTSCKTDTGVSLNDILLKGPVIQEELLYILLRFRTYTYVLTANIAKMYRQILVVNSHRDFQRLLWRAEPAQEIKIYRLNTLTYGTVPASFLATAYLEKLAESACNEYPDICSSIVNDFYMNDYIGGTMSKVKAKQLRDNLIDIMNSAALKLRKWMPNDKDLVTNLESNTDITRMIGDSSTKVLDLHWNSDEDVLVYTIRQLNDDVAITKRKILSEIATVFDPLGLLGPVIIKANIIMQNLYHIRADWDEPLPENIREEWQKYRRGLQLVNDIAIPVL